MPLLRSEAKTNRNECGSQMLGWIAALELVSLEELNGADTPALRIAIPYLESYGSKVDEAPRWRRYVQWSNANKGNAASFYHQKRDVTAEMNLGNDLSEKRSNVRGEKESRCL